MAKSPQRQGIESRVGKDGVERHRAYARRPSTEPGKRGPIVRGPWRTELSEARSDRIKLLGAKDAGTLEELIPSSAYPTIDEAIAAFDKAAREGSIWAKGGKPYAPRSLDILAQDFRLFISPALGPKRVDRVLRSDCQKLVGTVAVLSSPKRARMVASALGALYRYLRGQHDGLASPAWQLDLPAESDPRERVLLPDELTVRLDVIPRTLDRTFWALAGIAGLRRQEVPRVLVKDVDLEGRTLRVRGVKKRGETAGRVTRETPIFEPLVPHLERQLVSLGPDPSPEAPLAPRVGRSGRYLGQGLPMDPQQAVENARAAWVAAELEPEEYADERDALVPHTCRHSFASHLVAAGYDVATVAEWIGHERASTTLDVYVKPLRSRGLSREAVAEYLGPCPWDGYPSGYPSTPQR